VDKKAPSYREGERKLGGSEEGWVKEECEKKKEGGDGGSKDREGLEREKNSRNATRKRGR